MMYDDDGRRDFAEPYGRSALRKSSRKNPRIYPCPRCGRPNMLTAKDKARHYVCDYCADLAEGFGDIEFDGY